MTGNRYRLIFNKKYESEAISSGDTWLVPITTADVERYANFNAAIVRNFSNVPTEIRYNNSISGHIDYVPRGHTKIVPVEDGINYMALGIYNAGGQQFDAKDVVVSIQKLVSIGEYNRQQMPRLTTRVF